MNLSKSRAVAEEVVEKLQLLYASACQTDTPGMATLKAIQAFPGRVWQAVRQCDASRPEGPPPQPVQRHLRKH